MKSTSPTGLSESSFNTQPPEGGCAQGVLLHFFDGVSTHSRPKAAGQQQGSSRAYGGFQHTAARRRLLRFLVSQSQTKGFNTQPPEGGCPIGRFSFSLISFQHTAARRRLDGGRHGQPDRLGFNTQPPEGGWRYPEPSDVEILVSTHSRPKAAGPSKTGSSPLFGFNTQPPEGG